MTKKITSKVKIVKNKVKSLTKKVAVKVNKTVKSLKNEWKTEKPRREDFKKGLKTAASKMLKDSLKIGEDVVKIIKKDIREINNK